MRGVVEDMLRQTQYLDKNKYKVLVVWDAECNCDVGWITVRENCGGRKLEREWRDPRFEVRDWNFDTDVEIVANIVDVKDVQDGVDTKMGDILDTDTNMENVFDTDINTEIVLDTTTNGILKTPVNVFDNEQIMRENTNKDENGNQSINVGDDFNPSITANMDGKMKKCRESSGCCVSLEDHESVGGDESVDGCKPRGGCESGGGYESPGGYGESPGGWESFGGWESPAGSGELFGGDNYYRRKQMKYRETRINPLPQGRREYLGLQSNNGVSNNNGCVARNRKYRMRKCRVIIKHGKEVEAEIDRGVEEIWRWKTVNLHLRGTSQKSHCVYCGQIFAESWLSTHVNNFHLRTLKKCNECGIHFRNLYNMMKHRKLCNGVC